MDEVARLKSKYLQQIEDGRRIEVFTSMPEWQWYVEAVIKPTVNEYVDRIMRGSVTDEKQEWILRGMIQGLRLVVESPDNFKVNAQNAKAQKKDLEKRIKEEDEA